MRQGIPFGLYCELVAQGLEAGSLWAWLDEKGRLVLCAPATFPKDRKRLEADVAARIARKGGLAE